MHVQQAEEHIGGTIEWLCDTMSNDAKHALGNAPTSEFVIGPDGTILSKRAWGDPQKLRADLVRFVGKVDNPTSPDDVDISFQPPERAAESGLVDRLRVPRAMKPIVVTPNTTATGTPYYAKLRADIDESLLRDGAGRLYLGFFLDPIYEFHWNNLTDPIHIEFEAPDGVTIPQSLDGPKVDAIADVDPREFLIEVENWTSEEPIRVSVSYFACNDKQQQCLAVRQTYSLRRRPDHDGGWPKGRIDPSGVFNPKARRRR